jgi:hypothetical protein
MLLQLSLFPPGHEVQAQALAALDELRFDEALRLVAEARERDLGLVNLEPLHDALVWLRRELGSEPVTDELLALLFLTVPEACRNGELAPGAASLIDTVIARRGLARTPSARAFVDAEERVHRGSLLLVLRRFHEAHAGLAASLAEHDARADLWAAFGDASFALERLDEANAAMVRALVLGAREVDLLRLHDERLRALHGRLARLHGDPCARELLLVHAWLAGLLAIPPENGWLDGHLSRLHLAAALDADATPEQRSRRFSLLFYLDRSRAPGHYDEAEREEMQALEPELFGRVVQRIQERERTQTRPLRW